PIESSSTSTLRTSTGAREKGIDVALAVDFVADAVVDRYDVGIIFSTDTDLRPALEFVTSRFDGIPRAESAAWRVPGANRALFANNPRRTWCHFLTAADYDAVRDPTDYNV
ncbi:MAG: NYN domain-containing protein, partial [Dehalococcoidia bacterium]|nr:NYN domain-containing protein [Dehalococcoidia bacterium]